MTIILGTDVRGHAATPSARSIAGYPAVLVIDDVPLFARSLSFALRLLGLDDPWHEDQTVTADRLSERIRTAGVGVVVVDIADRQARLTLIRAARKASARVIAMVNSHDDLSEREAGAAGAEAVLVKARPFDELADELFSLIVTRGSTRPAAASVPAAVARNQTPRPAYALEALGSLSPREGEVLRWLMRGHTVDRIAVDAGLSIATVRSHVRAIHSKLGVTCQLAAVALAYGAGWPIDG